MKVGIFQNGGGLTRDARLERLEQAIAGAGLDLAVCPELFMSGYDIGDALPRLAEPADGAFAQAVSGMARRHDTAIAYGFPERDGDALHNSAACFDASGALAALHRKTLLPPGFESDYFTPGEAAPPVFAISGLRCALMICYEAEFPETVRAAAQAGAQLVLAPTALVEQWDIVAHAMMPSRAFENGVWLAYANHAGAENASRYLGASCILTPGGREAARAGAVETLIVADIDADAVRAARARLPYLRDVSRLRAILKSDGHG